MKKRVILLLALLCLVLLSGCGNPFRVELEEKAAEQDEDLIVVGVSQLGSESVWRSANTTSIRETFSKENGYVLIFENARQKQENQIKALRSFISLRVDYIILSPIVETGWDTVLKEAKDAGIPVILMDRQVKVSDSTLYSAWVGSNFEEEGRQAGKWLEEYLRGVRFNNDSVNIVVLQGTEGSTAMLGRTNGFHEIAENHPEWNILEQVDADFTTTKGEEEMRRLLETYDDIDVVVSQNDDMTFGALEAIQDAGRVPGTGGDIIIISFDAVKDALFKVRAGMINMDVECNPLLGEEIERLIMALENDEDIEKINYVSERVFTQKNVLSVLSDRAY